MLNYLKGSASAIIVAALTLTFGVTIMFIDFSFSFEDIYIILVYASILGYLLGLLGQVSILLIKRKSIGKGKSILLYLFLGGISGIIVEFIIEWSFFPLIIISTILGALTFWGVQKIQSKVFSCIISLPPLTIIVLFPFFM